MRGQFVNVMVKCAAEKQIISRREMICFLMDGAGLETATPSV